MIRYWCVYIISLYIIIDRYYVLCVNVIKLLKIGDRIKFMREQMFL